VVEQREGVAVARFADQGWLQDEGIVQEIGAELIRLAERYEAVVGGRLHRRVDRRFP
jgi:hypothetical protein